MSNFTLIVNEAGHETAAVLVEDDRIVCGLEQERVSRNRHAQNELSGGVIRRILEANDMSLDDIDNICLNFLEPQAGSTIAEEEMMLKYSLIKRLGRAYMKTVSRLPKIVKIEGNHHLFHMSASFYHSGFDSAVCLCMDGVGDSDDSVTIGYATKKDGITVIKKYPYKDSLGLMYDVASTMTTGDVSEGKFMALASFGHSMHGPTQYDSIGRPFIPWFPILYNEDGTVTNHYVQNGSKDDYAKQLENWIIENMPPFNMCKSNNAKKTPYPIMYYSNFAATIQQCLIQSYIGLAKYIKSRFPDEQNLCLSGGVALNCPANSVIDRFGFFKNIYCFPACNDGGTAWGMACEYIKNVRKQLPKTKSTAYYGPIYKPRDYNLLFNKEAFNVKTVENPKELADLIIDNGFIAWFQGESECGPRALGHRSLLGDPRDVQNWYDMSIKVKKREDFRPLAPIVLDKYYRKIFDDNNPQNLSEYMLKTVPIKPEWATKIPAVCHVNFSARPQVLKKEINPELYAVIEAFYEKTGIPLLVNTSLNLPGYAIIETPEEALAFIDRQIVMNNLQINLVMDAKYIVTEK